MESLLRQLADAVTHSDSLEDLVRPLLEMLEVVSGLESTYFTVIDGSQRHQRILFSRNTSNMQIPEDLEVPWGDTLCKRALDEGRGYTCDVDSEWGDSNAARELGIKTYLSEPVHIGNSELYGTLCGASSGKVNVSADARRLLVLFSTLIARQIEREKMIAALNEQNRDYMTAALTDPLTGIPNRRALHHEIGRALSSEFRAGHDIQIAFIDLDGFKEINDQFGHDGGDRFLIEMTRVLAAGLREGDMLARYGGDEFVVVATGPTGDGANRRVGLEKRVTQLTSGSFNIGTTTIEYAGPSVGVITVKPDESDVDRVLARADEAMYEIKKRRREGAGSRTH